MRGCGTRAVELYAQRGRGGGGEGGDNGETEYVSVCGRTSEPDQTSGPGFQSTYLCPHTHIYRI